MTFLITTKVLLRVVVIRDTARTPTKISDGELLQLANGFQSFTIVVSSSSCSGPGNTALHFPAAKCIQTNSKNITVCNFFILVLNMQK